MGWVRGETTKIRTSFWKSASTVNSTLSATISPVSVEYMTTTRADGDVTRARAVVNVTSNDDVSDEPVTTMPCAAVKPLLRI